MFIPPDLEAELLALMRQGRTVEAIKRLREATNTSLMESKEWVDERLLTLNPQPVRYSGKPCPFCGKPLRTNLAKQCFECGKDWHDEVGGEAP